MTTNEEIKEQERVVRSQKALSMGLRERGFEAFRTKTARCWRGLRLRREGEPLRAAGDGCRIDDATPGYLPGVDHGLRGAQAGSTEPAPRVEYPGDTSPTGHPSPDVPAVDGWEEGEPWPHR